MKTKESIGIIVASNKEILPFFHLFGKPIDNYDIFGYQTYLWKECDIELYLVKSGYGEIAAAAATQFLITNFGVAGIINYGVVGGLRDGLAAGQVGIVSKVVHYGFDLSGGGKYSVGRYPNQDDLYISPKEEALEIPSDLELPEFVCASADKFVYGGEPKRRLREDFGADICEMEAAGVILTCNKNGIPCTLIKAISDGVDEDEEAFENNVSEASKRCVELIQKLLL